MREEVRDLTIGQALDLGTELAMRGDHRGAIGLFRGVLIHEAENFEAIERLGSSLFELKHYYEALYRFDRGLKLNRKHPMALTNYGLCLSQVGHPDEGLPYLERAVYQAEGREDLSRQARALIYNNLGNTLERLQRYAEALPILEKGIAQNPNDAFPHYNRGIVLLRLNRHREALAAFDHALSLDPDNADAHYNRGMGRLVLGELKQGFEDYEYRLVTSETGVPNLGLPADKKWTGQDITGKTLLIHGEQGLGDDIQFFRYLTVLAERHPNAKLKLVCHTATSPLVEAARLPIELLKTGEPLAADCFDYWVPLMSLALRLGTIDEASIPAPFWFPVSTGRAEHWKTTIAPVGGALNVGCVWAGNFQHKNDAHRSIPLKQFGALFNTPGCNFVSLQQMRQEDMAEFAKLKEKHGDWLKALYFDDLRDTAAAILNLDVVVTVDTAVAHLAASLGVPTFILLPAFSTDWRWQRERSDSPWYPTARLLRQSKVGNWATVIAAVTDTLIDLGTKRVAA